MFEFIWRSLREILPPPNVTFDFVTQLTSKKRNFHFETAGVPPTYLTPEYQACQNAVGVN